MAFGIKQFAIAVLTLSLFVVLIVQQEKIAVRLDLSSSRKDSLSEEQKQMDDQGSYAESNALAAVGSSAPDTNHSLDLSANQVGIRRPEQGTRISSKTTKIINTAGHAISKLEANQKRACSCWMSEENQTNPSCCQRTIHYSHKMGSNLIQGLFAPQRNIKGVDIVFDPPSAKHSRSLSNQRNRNHYRVVMLTRNFVDSLISGYLYHRRGCECWLDGLGYPKPGRSKHFRRRRLGIPRNQRDGWEDFLRYRHVPWKPGNGRSICLYLEQESEADGLRVFLDFSISIWYARIYEFWNEVQREQSTSAEEQRNVLFVCFEDLSHPARRTTTFHQMMDWLNPTGGYDGRYDPQPVEEEYSGGHSTSHDAALRQRLRDIIMRWDRDMLDGWIERADRSLGCGL